MPTARPKSLNRTARQHVIFCVRGVVKLIWGVTGFDVAAGRFILPSKGGLSLTSNSFSAQSQYYFSPEQGSLDAPLSVFQTSQGGVAIYSTDTLSLGKDILLAT